MFGDLSEMMMKLKEAQVKIEETKKRLDTVLINGEAGNGNIKVTVTANGVIKNISISENLKDREEIEDYLIIALNQSLQKASEIRESELAYAAKNGMPNIPGLDLLD
ncbi:YbaB/EbfC family nucleoid-associated protein [Lutibacter sp.]|uniref:YbaB/EbfC family nucleoid-associated protein n=1 Tax=Lutibacter sp. TaxID=1925666 RepID=UPI0025B940F7|nr:YbaB/EbfC family nucleoid-associated protein [Lutibacter sp.]MCF6167311.1 YbaB/EbfC family nucleoid-associated protein [Lutibacter sp.]